MESTGAAAANGDGLAERIAYLIAGFIRGTLTQAEHRELDQWVEASESNMRLFEELTDEQNIEAGQLWFQRRQAQQEANEQVLQGIKERLGLRTRIPFYRQFLPYAVALFTLLLLGALFWKNRYPTSTETPAPVAAQPTPLIPYTAQVVLTLSNGSQVVLDSTTRGPVAEGAVVQANGHLAYRNSMAETEKFNTLTVPLGTQYNVVLPDGTSVWLNAQSSLRYPVAFTGAARRVELRGEGYFEVAKDSLRPFRVLTGTQVVEVLGTHFNINGYEDEGHITTTLLEGRVQVKQGSQTRRLQPGERAQTGAQTIQVEKADVGEAVAWKEGLFLFRNAPIDVVAAQLERWYGITVEYRGQVLGHFNATISRREPLRRLLTVLEGTGGVHFQLHGTRVIIQP